MTDIDEFFRLKAERNASGQMTVGEALIGRYYRLLDGIHAGKVIIHSRETIDGKPVVRFANGLTWVEIDKISCCRCEQTYPTFSNPIHEVDYKQATWYPDGSDEPRHHEW